MKPPHRTIIAATAMAALCSAGFATQARALAPLSGVQTAPDNSAQNKDQGLTADNQSNAKTDRQITANIRKAILADKDLSTYAHNVKVITVNGAVTLKGPVKSEDEKDKIASDAASVVSADKITNNLTVKQ
ncbi:MAG TPA: BON domain-containing protein [Silvibacterium sp.]|nr:BON domain-containing protein [Silvibacterium sp.]